MRRLNERIMCMHAKITRNITFHKHHKTWQSTNSQGASPVNQSMIHTITKILNKLNTILTDCIKHCLMNASRARMQKPRDMTSLVSSLHFINILKHDYLIRAGLHHLSIRARLTWYKNSDKRAAVWFRMHAHYPFIKQCLTQALVSALQFINIPKHDHLLTARVHRLSIKAWFTMFW